MIDGAYKLGVQCANTNAGCGNTGAFEGYNETHARAEARIAGWLFKADDVLCPKCAEPYQHKPRYPGGRRL